MGTRLTVPNLALKALKIVFILKQKFYVFNQKGLKLSENSYSNLFQ